MSTSDDLRALLRGPSLVHLPGVYDAVSALARRPGRCAGAAPVRRDRLGGRRSGVPDLGFVHGTDIARRAARGRARLAGCRSSPTPTPATATRCRPGRPPSDYAARGRRRAAPRGPGRAEALRPPRRQGGRRPRRGGRPGPGRGRRRRPAWSSSPAPTRCRSWARRRRRAVPGVRGRRRRRGLRRGRRPARLEQVAAAVPGVPLVHNRSEAGGPVDAGPTDAELAAVGVRLVIHPVSAVLAAARGPGAGLRRDHARRGRGRRRRPAGVVRPHRPARAARSSSPSEERSTR